MIHSVLVAWMRANTERKSVGFEERFRRQSQGSEASVKKPKTIAWDHIPSMFILNDVSPR